MNQGNAKLDNVLSRHGKKTEETMETCSQRPLSPSFSLPKESILEGNKLLIAFLKVGFAATDHPMLCTWTLSRSGLLP